MPRFAPWVADAVAALAGVALPAGPIVVPCCGTFPELPALAEAQPGRELVGIDLSAEMVRMANARAAGTPHARAVQGDASSLQTPAPEGAAAVVSVFGLQQLPDPVGALADWASVVLPGGRLSVVYWPIHTEDDGPFALTARVLAGDRRVRDDGWEGRLAPAITAAGLTLLRDELVSHTMTHPDADTYWEAAADGGSLRALAIERGPDFMAAVRQQFLELAPSGPWQHQPRARILVAQLA